MKYTVNKNGSVNIYLTKAERPLIDWALAEGLAGAFFEDDEEAKSNLDSETFKSYKHMGSPSWMGMIRRFVYRDKTNEL